jgi:Fic family protein
MPKLLKKRWEADFSAFGGRRAKAGFQYEAYVPDFIADSELLLPGDVAAVVSAAESAVRELNQPSKRLHSLEVLARQLLRAESVASSRIEGLELSHRRLAKANFAKDLRDVTAQSVLGNMRAMELAVSRARPNRPFRVANILAVHRELFGGFRDPSAGKVRLEQNWIGGSANNPRDAEFVPPPAEFITGLLEDLCRYVERDDIPAIAQAAVAHAQFETIHPFADGNGRVGRCLVHVVLRRRGVAPSYVPPISLILATNSKAYVGGLTDFRAGRAADWCAVFAQATRVAAGEAARFGTQIDALQDNWRSASGNPRRDSAAQALLEILPSHPILDVATAQALLARSNQAARLAVLDLEAAGVLKPITAGRRNRAWEAIGLFELMNGFELRLATRPGGKTRLRPAPRR